MLREYGLQPPIGGEGSASVWADAPDTVGILYEDPAELANGNVAIRAVCGAESNDWAGCSIYISHDNTTYTRLFQAPFRAYVGVLLTPLPAGTDYDPAATCDIEIALSPRELNSTDLDGLFRGVNRAIIGNEIVSWQTATLIGVNQYRLTGFFRSWYDTEIETHAAGTVIRQLSFLQTVIHRPEEEVDTVWYYKLVSYNAAGNEQDIATVGAQVITLTGRGLHIEFQKGRTKQYIAGEDLDHTEHAYLNEDDQRVYRAVSSSRPKLGLVQAPGLPVVAGEKVYIQHDGLMTADITPTPVGVDWGWTPGAYLYGCMTPGGLSVIPDGYPPVALCLDVPYTILIFAPRPMQNMGGPIDTMNEPTGFPNRTDSEMDFIAATRQFRIAPVVGEDSFMVWQQGLPFLIEGLQTITIPDLAGAHWIYFDNGVLGQARNPDHDEVDNLIVNFVFVTIIYWNATDGTNWIFADERHGVIMSGRTHDYLHDSRGASYVNGLGLSGYVLDTDNDAALSFEVSDGIFYDEDRIVEITNGVPANPYEQILNGVDAQIPVMYRDDVTGAWTQDAVSTLPYKSLGAGRLAYNNDDGDGTFSQIEVPNNQYVTATLVATNDRVLPIKMIQGQNAYASSATAIEEATNEILAMGDLPTPEAVILYRLILRTSNGMGGTKKAEIVSVTDFRGSHLNGIAAVANDHGTLAGLVDDDHAQYDLMPRGQVLRVAPAGAPYTDPQTAIHACTAGDIVLIESGTYNIASVITFPASNITVQGDNTLGVILNFTAADASHCLDLNGEDGITLTNFTIQAVAGKTGAGINTAASDDITLERLRITGDGLSYNIFADTGIRWRIIDCHLAIGTGSSIRMLGINCVWAEGNFIENDAGALRYAIFVTGAASDHKWIANTIYMTGTNASRCIYFADVDQVQVQDNYVLVDDDDTAAGIVRIYANNVSLANIQVSGNILRATNNVMDGVDLFTLNPFTLDDSHVDGNQISGCNRAVDLLDARVTETLVHGNQWRNNTAGLADAGTNTVNADNN